MHFIKSQQANRIDLGLLFMEISSLGAVTIQSPGGLSHDKLLWLLTLFVAPRVLYHSAFLVNFMILFLCSLSADHKRVSYCGKSSLNKEKAKFRRWGNLGKQILRRLGVWGDESRPLEHVVLSTHLMLRNSHITNNRHILKAMQTSSAWFSQIILEVSWKFWKLTCHWNKYEIQNSINNRKGMSGILHYVAFETQP